MSAMSELAAVHDQIQRVTPERVDAEILLLSVNEDSPLEQLAAASEAVDAEFERAKRNKEARDALFTEVVKRRGPFSLGSTRYWLSHPKTTKPKALLPLMRAVYEASGGDEEAFARTLSANAFKVGQCRSLLGAAFSDHFETVVKDKLESGEVAPKELTSADERWMK